MFRQRIDSPGAVAIRSLQAHQSRAGGTAPRKAVMLTALEAIADVTQDTPQWVHGPACGPPPQKLDLE